MRHRHVPDPGLLPALRVDRDGRAPAGAPRHALGLDDPGLSATRATVRRRARQGLRTVRGGVRRAARRVEGRDTFDDRRSERAHAGHRHGARHRAVSHRRRRERSRHVRVPAGGGGVVNDVAIIGVGLHPFGRFPGMTGIDMGAVAVRRALSDAGVQWCDVQFAFGGSYEVDNPDAVVALLGLTGIPFTDVYNGCATAASALTLAAQTIQLGAYDIGVAVGMDKHLPGAFSADPRLYACPSWYGEGGQFTTTKFFGMKINKYMEDHGISKSTLAKVAAKNYRNGSLNENAFRRKPLSE